jgi:hypothetical protein
MNSRTMNRQQSLNESCEEFADGVIWEKGRKITNAVF